MGYFEEVIPGVKFHFAKVEEGQRLLVQPDDYLKEMVEFDYKIRLKTNDSVDNPSEYLKLIQNSVQEWSDEEMTVVLREYRKHRFRMMRFKLEWPSEIHFVKTDGTDESNAAYCRGSNIVVLSENMLVPIVYRNKTDPSTLWHELWHILSRNNPVQREKLYNALGFKYMEKFEMPEFLVNHRLTNPDAPKFDVVMELDTEGDGALYAAPVCYYNQDEVQEGSFFPHYVAGLLVVAPHDEEDEEGYSTTVWKAATNNVGEIQLFSPMMCQSFWDQVGENTDYINHPEEIWAENFVHFMNQNNPDKEPLPSPRVVAAMDAIIHAA